MSPPAKIVAGKVAAALALLVLGCGTRRAEEAIDLADALDVAETAVETRSIDFAAPAARRNLGDGFWSAIEQTAAGEAFVWSNGASSEIVFTVTLPRALGLVLDGRPFDFPGAPSQRVTVEVGGRRLETLAFAGVRRQTLHTTVPAAALRRGENRLRLVYGHATRPRDVLEGNRDPRQLGVAWFGLHFGHQPSDPAAALPDAARVRTTRGEALAMPAASTVDYFLELPAGTRLAVDGWGLRAGPQSQLVVEVETEGGAARTVATISRENTPMRIDLDTPGGLVRLGLHALPIAGAGSGTAFVLDRPRLLVPAAAAAATAHRGLPASPPLPEAASRPDILLYLVDTLRADHLGSYGYRRPISPQFDAWAARSLVFEQAIAQSSWTRSSVASLMTGLWPRDHGANRRDEALSAAVTTLAEHLHEAGYATAGFVTNPNVAAPFGFDQGFEHYAYLGVTTKAAAVNEAALAWLEARTDDRPLLLYLHTIDPHAPYDPPTEVRQRLAPLVDAATASRSLAILDDLQAGRSADDPALLEALGALYDAEIASNDTAFGALLDGLDRRDRRTAVVFVSDHGEEFREHGNLQHGHSLHHESVHVPLALSLPEAMPGRVVVPVDHLDLFRTLLAIGGAGSETEIGGRDLRTVAAAPDDGAADRPIFSYLHLDGPPRASVRHGGWTLTVQLTDEGTAVLPRLYRTATDPGEREEVGDAHPVRRGFLLALLRARLLTRPARAAEPVRIDAELRESLQALGYLQ